MTDVRDKFFTPAYIAATYLSPKWGPRALMMEEKLAVRMYIKNHVKILELVNFKCSVSIVFTCSESASLTDSAASSTDAAIFRRVQVQQTAGRSVDVLVSWWW